MRKSNPSRARPRLEGLEARRLLSITVNGDAGGIARDDIFLLRRSGSTGQIFVNGNSVASASWDVNVSQSVTINGLLGNDRLTIDHVNGDPLNPTGLTFNGGAGDDELILSGGSVAESVALSSSQVALNARLAVYQAVERLTLNLGVGNDTVSASGNASVTAGVLRINVTGGSVRPATGTTFPQFTDLDTASNATFNLRAINTQVNNLTGTGRVQTDDGNATMTLGVNNGSSTFNGVLANGNATLALTKQGTGRITLGGNNSFGGVTNIQNGQLRITHDNALGSTGARTIVAGGTNTGLLELIGGRILTEPLELTAKSADANSEIAAHLLSVSGLNTIVSNISLQGGGTGHTLSVDTGTLRIAGRVDRLDGSTYHRPLHLRGAGEGRVEGGATTASSTWGIHFVKRDSGMWSVRDNPSLGHASVFDGTLLLRRIPGNAAAVIQGGSLGFIPGIRPGDVHASSTLPSVSFTGTSGQFDLSNHLLVVDYDSSSPIQQIRAQLFAGSNGGAWNGTGIVTSRAAQESNMSIGYAEASGLFTSFPATVAGRTLDATSLIVRYTLAGDSDLDGSVGFADLLAVSRNYGINAGATWSQGDFNYDGRVDFTDLLTLARQYGQSIEFARAWGSVPAASFNSISPSQFVNSELDLVLPLYHFHTLANSIQETGPYRGFINASVWRDPQDNEPYNARVLENHVALASFYTLNRAWNPYRGNRDVRDRLEALLDFWIESQDDRGWHAEYGWTNFSLAPTAFGLKAMVRTLELLNQSRDAGGPDIEPSLRTRLEAATLKGIRAMTVDDTMLNLGNDFSNQYSAIWGVALRFASLYPQHAAEINTNLAARLPQAETRHQSPAGFHYEAGGVDWAYTLGTHGTNLMVGWDLIRGSSLQSTLVDEATAWFDFASYNLLLAADGAGYVTNMGAASRLVQRYVQPTYTTPLSEFVPDARILNRTTVEESSRLSSQRASLTGSWNTWGSLNTNSSSSYTPGPFNDIDRVGWRPTAQQRTDAVNALPYIAESQFIQQNVDSRRPLQFTYVRNPSYYATLNTGNVLTSQQRYGLGNLWNPAMGAVMQTQSGSDNAAWGTRAAGAARVHEASTISGSFNLNGSGLTTQTGSRRLANGTLVVTYSMGSGRSKTVSFDSTGVTVNVTHPGNFSEEFPLLLRGSEVININNTTGSATLTRNGTNMVISWGPGRSASVVNPNIASFGGHNLRTLVVNSADTLSYRIEFLSARPAENAPTATNPLLSAARSTSSSIRTDGSRAQIFAQSPVIQTRTATNIFISNHSPNLFHDSNRNASDRSDRTSASRLIV